MRSSSDPYTLCPRVQNRFAMLKDDAAVFVHDAHSVEIAAVKRQNKQLQDMVSWLQVGVPLRCAPLVRGSSPHTRALCRRRMIVFR